MCTICHAFAVDPRSGGLQVCRRCLICVFCGERTITKKDGRCALCRCSACGSVHFQNFRSPNLARYIPFCDPCYLKSIGATACLKCKSKQATIKRRGDKEPSLCGTCAITDPKTGEPATHYCFFCKEKAVRVVGIWLSCAKHRKVVNCGTAECNPGAQCHRCQVKQRENERIQRLERSRLDLTDYQHEQQENGECFTDCRACLQIAGANVLFDGEVTFWPPSDGPNPALEVKDRRRLRSNRYIAVEIEVAGLHRPQRKDILMGVVKKWGGKIVRDGSLPAGGFEINTSPAAGDFFIRQMEEIGAALQEAGAFVNGQCGLHVHADARDFRYTDLRKLILYYEKLEPALQQTQPYTRGAANRYCQPVGKKLADAVREGSLPAFYKGPKGRTQPIKAAVMRAVYDTDVRRPPRTDHYAHSFGDVHYHAMNVHSWFFRGTVECRLHGGTVVARKMIDWATTWQAILDKSLRLSEADIAAITDPLAELLSVAPSERSRIYLKTRSDLYASDYKGRSR